MDTKKYIHLFPVIATLITITSGFTLSYNSVIASKEDISERIYNHESNKNNDFAPEHSDLNQFFIAQKGARIDVEGYQVYLGSLTVYFNLSDFRLVNRESKLGLGRVYYQPSLAFIVEAKRNFFLPIFSVKYYDSEMIQVGAEDLVVIEPHADWSVGMRGRGYIDMPSSSRANNITLIQVVEW